MIIPIYGEVTTETANAVRAMLNKDKTAEVEVRIDSHGGNLFAGLSIYQMLKERRTTVYIDGLAGSISSVIALAGMNKPNISSVGSIMIHNPHTTISGDHEGLVNTGNQLKKYRDILVNVYHEVSGIDKKMLTDLMKEETVLTSEEAVQFGFADRVFEAIPVTANVMNLIKANMNFKDQLKKFLAQAETPEGEESKEVKNTSENEDEQGLSEFMRSQISEMIKEAFGTSQETLKKELAEEVGEAVASILKDIKSESSAPTKASNAGGLDFINDAQAEFRRVKEEIRANSEKLNIQ